MTLGYLPLPAATPELLIVPEVEIRRHGPRNLMRICWRQRQAEHSLTRRGIRFRSTDPSQVAAAYAAMTAKEFDAVNGRQDWANWRTIPRCLSGHVPNRPLRILDLGCGTGSATRVLAWFAPVGSHITGYEVAESLLTIARGRQFLHRSGQPTPVDFVCQGVTETLREIDGNFVTHQSVEVVNASGVVGHHLDAQTISPLIGELLRVLRPEGIAMLDIGPTLPEPKLTAIMEKAGFRKIGRWRSWQGDPTGQVVYGR